MRFLGIDYGEKRVGLAVSDEGGRLAFPREVVINSNDLIEYILKIVEIEKIDEVVVGESLNYKGIPNKIEEDIKKFIKELRQKIKISVNTQKEFLTTVEARKGVELKNTNMKVDAGAAALILQRYLDKINNHHYSKTGIKS